MQPRRHRFRFQLGAMSFSRMVVSTPYRMVYPFLPVLARGVGVTPEAVALAITARATLGLASPFVGSVADVRGRKVAMLLGLGLSSFAMLLVSLWPTYPSLFVALVLSGVGKFVLDPAIQAFIGDRVDYGRRGFAIAVSEIGWSGGFLFGVPLVGWLIARAGWRAPFPWLALLGLLAMGALWRLLPSNEGGDRLEGNLANRLLGMLSHRPAVAGLALSALVSAGNETVTIVYGLWLEGAFGLQVLALGAASAVLGIAELGGEGLVAGLSDVLGKRRSVGLGMLCSAAACLGLPFLGASVTGALVGLFIFYITFEITIVSTIPLMTELLPGARATLLASNVAALSAGRAIGALIGPPLFSLGLVGNGAAAAALNVLALAILVLYVPRD